MKATKIVTLFILICAVLQINLHARDISLSERFAQIGSCYERAELSLPAVFTQSAAVVNRYVNLEQQNERIYSRPSAANVSETIIQDWVNGTWQNKSKDIMKFNDMTNEIVEATTYNWVNGQWINATRMQCQLDANGYLISMTMEMWKNNAWVIELKMLYENNSAGDPTLTLIQGDDNGDGVLEDQMKTESVYNGSGFLVSETSYSNENGSWTEMTKTTYTNNAQGLPIEEISQMPLGGGQYMNMSKKTSTYDTAGNLLVTTSFAADFITQGWTELDRTTYTYNSSNMPITILDETHAGAWINDRMSTFTYEGGNRETGVLHQVWDGSAWQNKDKSTSTYDSQNRLTEIIFQEWVGSWQNRERWLNSYTGTAVVKRDIQKPNKFSLGNYPNPFNPSTKISFFLPAETTASLHIYDMRGQFVCTLFDNKHMAAGHHEIFWNSADIRNHLIPSGVYLIKLICTSHQMTSRAVLIK